MQQQKRVKAERKRLTHKEWMDQVVHDAPAPAGPLTLRRPPRFCRPWPVAFAAADRSQVAAEQHATQGTRRSDAPKGQERAGRQQRGGLRACDLRRLASRSSAKPRASSSAAQSRSCRICRARREGGDGEDGGAEKGEIAQRCEGVCVFVCVRACVYANGVAVEHWRVHRHRRAPAGRQPLHGAQGAARRVRVCGESAPRPAHRRTRPPWPSARGGAARRAPLPRCPPAAGAVLPCAPGTSACDPGARGADAPVGPRPTFEGDFKSSGHEPLRTHSKMR